MAPTGLRTPQQTGYDVVQAPRFSPDKMQQMQQLRGTIEPGYLQGLGNLSKIAGGDESYFQQLEAPAMRQFGQMQGQISSRFSGAGSGARHSSGFQNEMSGAAGNLAEKLQGQRLSMQQQALQQLMGIYNDSTEDPYEMLLAQKQQKDKGDWWRSLLKGALPIAGGIGGAFLGGPWGAMAGSQIGGAAGQAF